MYETNNPSTKDLVSLDQKLSVPTELLGKVWVNQILLILNSPNGPNELIVANEPIGVNEPISPNEPIGPNGPI